VTEPYSPPTFINDTPPYLNAVYFNNLGDAVKRGIDLGNELDTRVDTIESVAGQLRAMPARYENSNYTLTLADRGKIIAYDAASAAGTYTLPATATPGDTYIISQTWDGPLTVQALANEWDGIRNPNNGVPVPTVTLGATGMTAMFVKDPASRWFCFLFANVTRSYVDGLFTRGNELRFPTNLTNIRYPVDSGAVVQSPIPGTLWHDLMAWPNIGGRWVMEYETSTDGTTFVGADEAPVYKLFTGKDAALTEVASSTQKAARFKFTGTDWSGGQWLLLAHGYSDPVPGKIIHVESSSDGTTWTTRHLSETHYDTATPIWYYISSWAGDNQIRVTITHVSGHAVILGTMRMLTARWGDQGDGQEYEWPLVWNDSRSIGIGYTESDSASLTQRLHVAGDVALDGIRLKNPSNGSINARLVSDGSNRLLWDGFRIANEVVLANVKTASHTLDWVDEARAVEMNVATANNLTVPDHATIAFAIGAVIEIAQIGAGQTTIVPAAGVTIRTARSLTLRAQYSVAYLRKRSNNEWILSGDLT
jgi:hypothetical protein